MAESLAQRARAFLYPRTSKSYETRASQESIPPDIHFPPGTYLLESLALFYSPQGRGHQSVRKGYRLTLDGQGTDGGSYYGSELFSEFTVVKIGKENIEDSTFIIPPDGGSPTLFITEKLRMEGAIYALEAQSARVDFHASSGIEDSPQFKRVQTKRAFSGK